MLMEEKYLNKKEIADRLGLKVSTINANIAKDNGLPYYKIGGAVRFKLSEVEQWVQSQNKKKGK